MPVRAALAFLESVYGAFLPEHRISPTVISAAEDRLGIVLPAALRTLYEVTGASTALHHAHNEIVPAGEIDFVCDHLVFYKENQAVVVWGIPRAALGQDDPPVEQGQHDDETDTWSFYPEFASFSEFACAQGAWQAVQGGLPYVGVREGVSTTPERFLGKPTLVSEGMSAWPVDGGVALALPGGYLGLATHTAEQFEHACAQIGIAIDSWDYATLRDE